MDHTHTVLAANYTTPAFHS